VCPPAIAAAEGSETVNMLKTYHFPELIRKQDKRFASGKYAFSKVSNSRNCAKNVEGSVTTYFTL